LETLIKHEARVFGILRLTLQKPAGRRLKTKNLNQVRMRYNGHKERGYKTDKPSEREQLQQITESSKKKG
jgi:hypothetical protein